MTLHWLTVGEDEGIRVTPRAERTFRGRRRAGVISRDGSVLVVQLERGPAHVLNRDLETVRRWRLPAEVTLEDLSHDGRLAAVSTADAVLVVDASGRTLCEAAVPGAFDEGDVLAHPQLSFSSDAQHLWVALHPEPERAQIQLRRVEDLSLVAQRDVKAHAYRFWEWKRHPDPRLAGLETAEPDYQEMCWVSLEAGSLQMTPPREIAEQFALHPSGREMLHCTSGGTARVTVPGGKLLGEAPCEEDNPGRPYVGQIAYLSDSRAIVATLEGALCLLDVDQMRVLGPLRVGAHELRRYESRAGRDFLWAGDPPKAYREDRGIREWVGDSGELFSDDRGSVYSWHGKSLVAWPDGAFGKFTRLARP